jgi:hypothetical protein
LFATTRVREERWGERDDHKKAPESRTNPIELDRDTAQGISTHSISSGNALAYSKQLERGTTKPKRVMVVGGGTRGIRQLHGGDDKLMQRS